MPPSPSVRRLLRIWFPGRLMPRREAPLPPFSRLLDGLTGLALWPVSWGFALVVQVRRLAYRWGWLRAERLPVPVVVVGNLTVGGAGKTPLVVRLAQDLAAAGRHPGIVSRGYGAEVLRPQAVSPEATAAAVGDEPLLLARRTGVPVWVGRDRVATGRALLAAHPEVDVLLCDDGLQHYRLARDVEIVVFDARGAGNGRLLPAGPLREPLSRLAQAHALVYNELPDALALRSTSHLPAFQMSLEPGEFVALAEPQRRCQAQDLAGKVLHGVAGIGDPGRFFRTLGDLGLTVVPHPFPDHHAYRTEDFSFLRPGEVALLTEKDGVKCARLHLGEAWVLPVEARVTPDISAFILESLHGRETAGHPGVPPLQG